MTTYDTGRSPYESLPQVKRANKERGHHFFSPGAMEFFHCRIESGLIRGRYFITSEQREEHTYVDARGREQDPTERKYSIRYAQDDGSIETVGEVWSYDSSAEAMAALLKHDQERRTSHAV